MKFEIHGVPIKITVERREDVKVIFIVDSYLREKCVFEKGSTTVNFILGEPQFKKHLSRVTFLIRNENKEIRQISKTTS